MTGNTRPKRQPALLNAGLYRKAMVAWAFDPWAVIKKKTTYTYAKNSNT